MCAATCAGPRILPVHFAWIAGVLISILIVALISVVRLAHLIVVALGLVTDARACPDGVDALAVRLALAARLGGLLA